MAKGWLSVLKKGHEREREREAITVIMVGRDGSAWTRLCGQARYQPNADPSIWSSQACQATYAIRRGAVRCCAAYHTCTPSVVNAPSS